MIAKNAILDHVVFILITRCTNHSYLQRGLVRVVHGLVIVSLVISNLSVGYVASAASPQLVGGKPTNRGQDPEYSAPMFTHHEPRRPLIPNQEDIPDRIPRAPFFSILITDVSTTSGFNTDVSQVPPGEPFTVLESHAEFAHPWIQVTDFSTNCPVGLEPAERYGVCEATFTFYNGSGFTISEYGGYDLRVGYIDTFWRNQEPTYYTSVTEICRVGHFNRVESCLHQPVIQNEVFKAQNNRFPIGSHESITMSKTIFWSLDPDVWWNDPRSSDSSCTNKNKATDERECPLCNPAKTQGYASDPINSLTGVLDYQVRDLSVMSPVGPLTFSRCYTSSDSEDVGLGFGWVHNHASQLTFPSDPDGEKGVVWFQAHCANQYAFIDHEDGTYTAAPGVTGTLVLDVGPPLTYSITNAMGSSYLFNDEGRLLEWADAEGRSWSYTYDGSDRFERVTDDTSGRYLEFVYDPSDKLVGVMDHTSRGVSFTHDGAGDLTAVTDALGGSWSYTYDPEHRLTEVVDPRGLTEVRNEYDGDGRGVRQYNGEAELMVELTYNSNGTTDLTDALGNPQTHSYDSNNALVANTDALGGVTAYTYGGHSKMIEISDPLGHLTEMTWGPDGVDLHQVVDAAGSLTNFSYDSAHHLTEILDTRGFLSTFIYSGNLLTSATDALGGVKSYTYTPEGYVETVTDALGRVTSFTYDGAGQPVSMTDALGNTWTYDYDALGRLTDVIDPLGRVTHSISDDSDQIVELSLNYNPSKSQNEDDEWNIVSVFDYDSVGNLLNITDTYGRVTSFTYDDANRLLEIHDSTGNSTSNSYDAAGNMVSSTDPLGRTTTHAYDANNRLHSITDPGGNVYTLSYDLDATIGSSTDALGRTTSFIYDVLGQLQSTTDPLGNTSLFTYDSAGNLTQITNALGNSTTYEYDALNRRIRETDALGNVTEHFYDAVGNWIQTVDARGNATTYAYDSLNQLIALTDPLGHTTTYTYDVVGNLLTSTDPLGNITTLAYDGLNRRTQVVNPLGNTTTLGHDAVGNLTSFVDANGVETQFEYDALTRLTAVVENYLEAVPSDNQTNVRTDYTYDEVGNLVAHQDAHGGVTSYAYDGLDRLISFTNPLGDTTSFGYDAVGNRINKTDEMGFVTSFTYNAGDRLVGIDYPSPDPDVSFDYDAVGNLLEMIDGFGTTSWTYDALDRTVTATDPFSTTVGYSYDAVGNRLSMGYGGKTTSYAYDAADRLHELTDWTAGITEYAYDAADRLHTVNLPNGVESEYQYDAAGQLASLSHQLGGVVLADYVYSYDPVGNPTQAIESIMEARVWIYLPLLMKDVTGSSPEISGESIELDSSPSASSTPGPTASLTSTSTATATQTGSESIWTATPTSTGTASATHTSTATNTPLPIGTATDIPSPSSATLEDQSSIFAGTHGWINPRAAIRAPSAMSPNTTFSQFGSAVLTRTIDYEYDPLNRLKAADYSSGEFFNYAYDATGNRIMQESDSGTTLSTYDAAQRLASVDGLPYTWTANGQLLTDGQWTYDYDHAGRLVGAADGTSTYAFGYNGLGDRIWLDADGITSQITLDTNRPLAQVLSDGSTDYLHGLGRVGEAQPEGWMYNLPDGLGSLRQGADASGYVALSRCYSPFGELAHETAFQTSAYGFTGEWTDPTNLIFLRARYYAPEQGRFTSPDPFPGFPIAPATLHPYLYVVNNPLRYTDPSGEVLPFLAIVALAALASGGAAALFEYGSQVHNNMKNCGMSFWDATYYQNLDASRLGMAFLEGFVMGGFGALTGGMIAAAGLTGVSAFAIGALIDIEAGMIWDIAVRGFTPSEAFIGNVIAFGMGEVIGVTARRAARAVSQGARGGIGPVLKGQIGVGKSMQAASDRGWTFLGSEITIETPSGTRVRPDIAYLNESGQIVFIESKNGPWADLTPNQKVGYPEIMESGGIPVGANAEKAGFTLGEPIGPTEILIDRWEE